MYNKLDKIGTILDCLTAGLGIMVGLIAAFNNNKLGWTLVIVSGLLLLLGAEKLADKIAAVTFKKSIENDILTKAHIVVSNHAVDTLEVIAKRIEDPETPVEEVANALEQLNAILSCFNSDDINDLYELTKLQKVKDNQTK